MQKDLNIEGKKYISTKKASELSGYTSDYIGQLSRANLIKSTIIGKTKFVEEEGLSKYIEIAKNNKLLHKNGNGNGHENGNGNESVEFKKTESHENNINYYRDEFPLLPNLNKKSFFDTSIKKDETFVISPFLSREYFTNDTLFKKIVSVCFAIVVVFGPYALSKTEYAEVGLREIKLFAKDTYELGKEITQKINEDGVIILMTDSIAYTKNLLKDETKKIVTDTASTILATNTNTNTNTKTTNFSIRDIARTIFLSINSFFEKDKIIEETKLVKKSEISQPTSIKPLDKPTNTTTIIQPTKTIVIEGPTKVIERVVEQTSTIGITKEELDARIQQLDNKLSSKIYSVSSGTPNSVQTVYNVVSQTNKIDKLASGVEIISPAITGGTLKDAIITGSTFSGTTIDGSELNVSGNTTIGGRLNVSGVSTFGTGLVTIPNIFGTNATITNATSTNFFSSVFNAITSIFSSLTSGTATVGSLTATSSATLSYTGTDMLITTDSTGKLVSSTTPQVASINATSTTATSTFAGGLAIETSGLVYDYSSNNVGIGTASPTSRLQIVGGEARIGNGGTVDYATGDGSLYVKNILEVDGSAQLGGTLTLGGKITSSYLPTSTSDYAIGVRPTATNPTARYLYDGASYTDVSTMIGDTGDYSYYGYGNKFTGVYLSFATPGLGYNLVVEYSRGAGVWNTVTITDDTTNLTANGNIYFDAPSNWATDSVNGSSAYYWIRLKTTTNPTVNAISSNNYILPAGYAFAAYLSSEDVSPKFYADYKGNVQVNTLLIAQDLEVSNKVSSNLIPESASTYNLGTGALPWNNLYADTVTATNLVGTVVTGSTVSADWTINSDNASADTENMSVVFERGSETPNAVLSWNSTSDQFELNGPLVMTSGIGTATLTLPGNVNTTGGAFQTNSVTRLDNAGNLSNIGSYTSSVTPAGSTAVDLIGGTLTNNTTSGNQTLLTLTNAGTGTTEKGIYLNNTGTGTNAIEVAGTWTNGLIVGSGNVGIGTTSPFYKLSVEGSSSLGDEARANYFNATSTTATSTFAGGLAIETSGLVYDYSTNNVGIGTTAPAEKLHVVGRTSLFGVGTGQYLNIGASSGEYISIGNNVVYSSGTAGTYFYRKTDAASLIKFGSGGTATSAGMMFKVASSGTIDSAITFTDAMTILNNGNVGIGTTSPYSKLSVWGADTLAHSALEVTNSASTTLMTVLNSGNVGIGTTAPTGKLDVVNNGDSRLNIKATNSTAFAILGIQSGDTGNSYLYFGRTTNDNEGAISYNHVNNLLSFRTNTISDRMVIDNNGNVGIGTTAPGGTLEVVGNSTSIPVAKFKQSNSAGYGKIIIDSPTDSTSRPSYMNYSRAGSVKWSTGLGYSLTSSGNYFSISTSDLGDNGLTDSKFVIDTNGNVGIGTTGPQTPLHVNGGIVGVGIYFNGYSASNLLQASGLNGGGDDVFAIKNTNTGASSALSFGTQNTEKVRITASGNVGIGTTAPTHKLEVNGNMQVLNDGLYVGTTANPILSALSFSTGGFLGLRESTGTTNNIALYANPAVNSYINAGNVGIGTTNPGRTLEVGGNGIKVSGGVIDVQYNSSSIAQLTHASGDGNIYIFDNLGNTDILLRADDTSYILDGNVGIGTTTPGSLLHLSGTTPYITIDRSSGTQPSQIIFSQAGTVKGYVGIVGNTNGIIAGSVSGDMGFRTESGKMMFSTDGGTAMMTILNSGYVGIGTTAPENKLSVGVADTSTTQSSSAVLNIFNTDTTVGNMANIAFGQGAASNSFSRIGVIYRDRTGSSEDQDIFFGTVGGGTYSEKMRILSTGNVGIGTTAPGQKLHVVGNAYITSSTYTDAVEGYNNGGAITFGSAGLTLQATTGDYMAFNTNGANEKMRILSDGNVGIGTTAPGAQLHVIASAAGTVGQIIKAASSQTADLLQFLASDGVTKKSYFDSYGGLYVPAIGSANQSGAYLSFANDSPVTVNTNGAAKIGLVVKGAVSQTADLQQWQTSTGSVLGVMTSSGNVGIGTTSPYSKLSVWGSDTLAHSALEVTNSASTTLMTVLNSGNIGIGTTAPTQKLDVNGGVNIAQNSALYWQNGNSSITGDGSMNLKFATWDGSALTEKMRILGNGNVGIGTTSPYSKLSVWGSDTLAHSALEVTNSASTTLMTVLNSGNVGIGTTAPTQKLEVSGGSIYATSGGVYGNNWFITGSTGYIGWGATTDLFLYRDGAAGILAQRNSTNAQEFRIYNTDSTADEFVSLGFKNNSNIFTIETEQVNGGTVRNIALMGGLVGIGTTSPYSKLSVWGSDTLAHSALEVTNSASTTLMTVLNSGNVGIGTTAPTQKLQIYDATDSRIAFSNGSVTSYIGTGSSYDVWNAQNTAMRIATNGTQRLGISAAGGFSFGTYAGTDPGAGNMIISGNVGIGTTSPGSLLYVYKGTNFVGPLATVDGYYIGDFTALSLKNSVAEGTGRGVSLQFSGLNQNYGAIRNLRSSDSSSYMTFETANSSAVLTERVRIDNSGNVGIGTTTPFSKLSVVGDTWFDSNIIRFASTTATSLVFNLQAPATTTIQTNKNYAWTIATSTTASPILQIDTTGDIATAVIGGAGSGNVTIGDANSPTNLVFGASSSILGGGTNTITFGQTGDKFNFAVNLGIGTSTPYSALSVGSGNASTFNGAICADNGGLVKCYGTLTAGTVYGDASSFSATDLAENYSIAETNLEAGDIVAIANNLTTEENNKRINDREKLENLYKGDIPQPIIDSLNMAVKKATNRENVIGIISSNPGVLLGDTTGVNLETTLKPVALSGRVPVKVNNEGGTIKRGDKITLSSIPGVGTKATTTTAIVGIALEDFNDVSGIITAFVNLASSNVQDNSELLASMDLKIKTIEEIIGVSTTSSSVVDGASPFLATEIIQIISDWFSSLGVKIYSGLVEFKKIVAETFTIGSASKPSGITMYDEDTGEPYCLKIKNGVMVSTAGECQAVSTQTSQTANVVSSTADTEPPVITLVGSDPAQIEKGTSFVDPGATVTDNVTQGIIPDMVENTVNTSLVGEYQVIWTAHDSALNYATTTRTVIVIDPYASTVTTGIVATTTDATITDTTATTTMQQ